MSNGRRKKSVNGGAPAQIIADDRRSSLPELEASPLPGKQAVIKSADMKEDMQKEAIDIAISAFEKYSGEKDIAENIKKEFDKKHGAKSSFEEHMIIFGSFDIALVNLSLILVWLILSQTNGFGKVLLLLPFTWFLCG